MQVLRIAVVGAGIVGLFTALRAAEAGAEVTVYTDDRPGSGATSANANVLHAIQPPPGRLRRRLAREGALLHRRYARLLGYRVMETRLVVPAYSVTERVRLRLMAVAARLLGSRPVIVSGSRALEIEPALRDDVLEAMVVEGYGVVDSREVVARIVERLSMLGVDIVRGRVESLHPEPSLTVDESRVRYDAIINAAGGDAARLASTVGDMYKVHLVPGVMTLHRGPRLSSIVARPVWRPGEGKGGGLIPQLDGSVLAGPTWGAAGPSQVREAYEHLIRDRLEPPHRVIWGLRTVSSRRDFIIERSRLNPRIIHLIGIESPGLTAAPAIAAYALSLLGVNPPTRP